MGQADQSVEEILASIKRIIIDEDAPPPPRAANEADDVLELTQPLDPRPLDSAPELPPVPPARGLVSAGPADASRQALAYLSSLNLRQGDPQDDSLHGLVREMLKPMLKAWLDAELPGIVERLVVQEIARLTAERG